jgi:hypothetical membrane protein
MKIFIHHFRWFGIVGTAIITIASLITGFFFRTSAGYRYSPLNHFISELGWEGHSSLAWLFNVSLIITGILFIFFIVGLGLLIRGVWAKIAMASGLVTAIFCALVGVFPMNHLPQHTFVAMWFFRGGLATVTLFAIAFLVQPRDKIRISKTASLVSIPAFLAFGSFLILATTKIDPLSASTSLGTLTEPPPFRLLAVVEWSVFICTILWFLGVALLLPRVKHPSC